MSERPVIVRIPICHRCERPIDQHSVFHDAPTPEQLAGLTEGDFEPFQVHGVYCLPT